MIRRSERFPEGPLLGLAIILAIVVTWATISSVGIWIDEFATWRMAQRSVFSVWLEGFLSDRTSDIQKPFYHLYMYAWVQVAGLSAQTIRLANAPWLLAALLAVAWSLRTTPDFAAWITLSLAMHPLLWFYMNDAQPYVMFYANTVLCCAGLYRFFLGNNGRIQRSATRNSIILLFIGLFLLSGTTLLGVCWAGVIFLLAVWIWITGSHRYRLTAADVTILVVFIAAMAALFAFYVFTLARGSSATQLHETNLATLVFSIYEILGLGGLGPGRNDLRDYGIGALVDYLPSLLVGISLIVPFLVYSAKQFSRVVGSRRSFLFLMVVLAPIVFTNLVGYIVHWRVLGRHLMPGAVVVALLLGFGFSVGIRNHRQAVRVAAVATLLMLTISAVSYGSARHAKEDYRGAAAIAIHQILDGRTVWWVAADQLAQHYGLNLMKNGRPEDCSKPIEQGSSARLIDDYLRTTCISQLQPPDYIFMSRPDAYDPDGEIQRYIREGQFEEVDSPAGFRIWRSVSD